VPRKQNNSQLHKSLESYIFITMKLIIYRHFVKATPANSEVLITRTHQLKYVQSYTAVTRASVFTYFEIRKPEG
jgi:hypothetical protein